ncbi:hypothetical protein MN116_003528 [Schistosoma mekongi]|uniref:Sodium/potassium-transporting ATPase subunit beta n=1 Tax=Schistosoma mekongi TaxID=38744 RepID=A0AAE1ZF21_SCHME|nr:hypothetical protein MN116_003528 [Schistosoma mekongi]
MKKAVQRSRFTRFKRAIYNPEKNEILGRTCRDWVLIFIFYVLAYLFLAGFFIGMLSVFLFGYVDSNIPTLTGEQSILKFQPGIGLAAKPNYFSTFIHVASFQSTINEAYINKVDEIFRKYIPKGANENCNTPGLHPKNPDIPCGFDLSVLGECQDTEKTLMQGKLCVYLKINRIYGWLPNLEDPAVIPSPGIECGGTNEFDRESLGTIRYFPEHTAPNGKKYGVISNNYFPYFRMNNYQDPLVAVQFLNVTKNSVVLVECHLVGLKNTGAETAFEVSVDDQDSGK